MGKVLPYRVDGAFGVFYGFKDAAGTVVVEPQFVNVSEFFAGFYSTRDFCMGEEIKCYIDRYGNVYSNTEKEAEYKAINDYYKKLKDLKDSLFFDFADFVEQSKYGNENAEISTALSSKYMDQMKKLEKEIYQTLKDISLKKKSKQ